MAEQLTLDDIAQGQTAIVEHLVGQGAFRKRLLEMGFVAGTEVYVQKFAPLKDPVEYVIKGYHVSLRHSEAAQIVVRRKEG